VGGGGLICSGLFNATTGFAVGDQGATYGLAVTADAFWCLGVLVLAWGLHRDGSVVSRRPLGLAALFLVAIWPLSEELAQIGGLVPGGEATWYLLLTGAFAAALIASVSIARVRVVPSPWNWAPLWVLALRVIASASPQLVSLIAPELVFRSPTFFAALAAFVSLVSTVGLGTLAIVLATRRTTDTVQILPSPRI